MNIVIGGVLVLINMAIYLKDEKKGLTAYILMACIVPLSVYHEYKISYEILGFIGIFGCWILMAIVKRRVVFRKIYILPLSYMGIYGIATLISAIKYEAAILWTVIFGAYRVMLLFVLFTQVQWERNSWKRFMDFYIIINSICVAVQVVFPNVFPIFEKYYMKNALLSKVFYLTWGGRYARVYGITAVPSILSYIAVVAFIVYLCRFLNGQMIVRDYIMWGLAIICGVSTATKAFFLGIVLCVAGALLACFWFFIVDKKRNINLKRNSIKMVTCMLACVCVVSIYLDARGVMVGDYIKKSMKIISALETRYDLSFVDGEALREDSGVFVASGTYVAPQTAMSQLENLVFYEYLIGVGATRPYGEDVQDSGWFMMVHEVGIIGVLIVIGWIAWYVIGSYKARNIELLLYELMLYVLGLAISSIMSFLGILLMAWVYNYSYLLSHDTLMEEKGNEENIVLH